MADQFSGKVAIVTGSSSGLGEAIAAMMVKKGANVTLCGRDSKKLESVAECCSRISGRPVDSFLLVVGDVCQDHVRREMIEMTVAKYGRIDILVNNAGLAMQQCEIDEVDEESYDRTMDVNLKAAFFLSQIAIPYLAKSRGCIVNMSSMVSQNIGSQIIVYALSKAAMDHMTRSMAFGLAPKGIRVNAVNPAWIPGTGIMREFPIGKEGDPQTLCTKNETTKMPLHGTCMTADDVANAVCYLASQDARFITGQCHVVDGGRHFLGPF